MSRLFEMVSSISFSTLFLLKKEKMFFVEYDSDIAKFIIYLIIRNKLILYLI